MELFKILLQAVVMAFLATLAVVALTAVSDAAELSAALPGGELSFVHIVQTVLQGGQG